MSTLLIADDHPLFREALRGVVARLLPQAKISEAENAGALYALGVELQEALLWGTMAALLNFAPYVGPLIGMIAKNAVILIAQISDERAAGLALWAAVFEPVAILQSGFS